MQHQKIVKKFDDISLGYEQPGGRKNNFKSCLNAHHQVSDMSVEPRMSHMYVCVCVYDQTGCCWTGQTVGLVGGVKCLALLLSRIRSLFMRTEMDLETCYLSHLAT
jgi:hypothetical protein